MEDKQQCKYVLSKLSENWFDLHTDNISHVRRVLELFTCDICMHRGGEWDEFCLPHNYDELESYDQVMHLLSTSCGAEFMLEEDGEEPTYELVEEL